MLRLVQISRDPKEIDDAIKTLKEETNELSDQLIGREMQLVEQHEVFFFIMKTNIIIITKRSHFFRKL